MAILGASTKPNWVSLLTTELNGLPNNSSADFTLDLNTYRSGGSGSGVYPLLLDLALDLASFNPTTLTVNVYCLPAIDDTPTDYADESEARIIWTMPLSSGTSRKKDARCGLNLTGMMSRYAKIRVKNATGVAFAASGNILKAKFTVGDESA